MKVIVLQIVRYIAVLASFPSWPDTSATSTGQPAISLFTFPSSTTFDPKGTPCEGVSCSSGKHCAVNENFKASCVCDSNCDDSPYLPVCGSDNKTYSSNCEVIRKACTTTNTNLAIDYNTACLHEGSLCNGIVCPLNRVCAVADGRPICVCSMNCPTFARPVCGTDNQTYINDCVLRRQSCLTNKNVKIDFYGECKQATKCDGLSCQKGTKCAIDELNKAVCVCNDTCLDATDIVCGTDGRTYGSECELYSQACISYTGVRLAYKGYCLEGSVCFDFRCPKNKKCSVNQANNKPVCICAQNCRIDWDPVCGSDGVTYSNLCQLEMQACTAGSNLAMVRKGQCIYDIYCYAVICPYPTTCVVDEKNQTSCVCSNNCENVYSPVCGSDNKTYDNYCLFIYAGCQKNLSTYYYNGICSSGSDCQGIYCPIGQHCDSVNHPEPQCVCNTVCSKMYSPVCGTNNKTYNNPCELQKDACITNTSIWSSFDGRCEDGPGCMGTSCPLGQTCAVDEHNRPMCVCSPFCIAGITDICGTDDKTYSSECFLNAAACLTNKTIAVQRYAPCKKDSPCDGVVCSSERHCEVDQNGRPICVCNDQCLYSGSVVCGNDNKTYTSNCQLKMNACFSGSDIQWSYYGSCAETSICDKISCPRSKWCAVDEQYRPTCVCIDECIAVQDPVCGSDGRTYMNECEMQRAACVSNRNVTLAYKGKCDKGLTCSDISCATGRVCGLNEENRLTCVCNTDCTTDFPSPVCGTDGKTYAGICYLWREACTKSKNIVLAYAGSCTNDANATTTEIGLPCVGALCST